MTKTGSPERTLFSPVSHLADGNAIIRHPADKGTWIWHPDKSATETAVLRFRLRFNLQSPATPLIHVTGDQRFQLRCDGREVTFGPDRCDPAHWTVQSIALELGAGDHELEALVWFIAKCDGGPSEAAVPPMAQMSVRGGFLVYAEGVDAALLNTGSAPWTVEELTDAVEMNRPALAKFHYLDVGPEFNFDLERWRNAPSIAPVAVVLPVQPNGGGVRRPGWCLFPADLPEQERKPWTGGVIRAIRLNWEETPYRAQETRAPENAVWQGLIDKNTPVTVPPHSKMTVLWDLQDYYCGYPVTRVEGGEGSFIQWAWAESLYEASSAEEVRGITEKGNRNAIENKVFIGIQDGWRVGATPQTETPSLWWRAGRYIRVRVETGDLPLKITHLGLITTGFPLGRVGAWKSTDAAWDRVMPIFERAFRCSAHETWTDTPYYEQMCYVGDTTLHSLANYAWFSDTRISRRCVEQLEWSRLGSGFVAERYPCDWRQESPTFSLIWPQMVRDFAWWCDDVVLARKLLTGVRSVLAEFDGIAGEDGLLHKVPGWPFVDWVGGGYPDGAVGRKHFWEMGCGPGVREGDSSIVNLHWVLAHLAAMQLEEAYGEPLLAQRHRQMARRIFDAVVARYWDKSRGILLDTHGSDAASEHAQAFALVTGLLDPEKAESCLSALAKSDGLAEATIYFSFYVLDAFYRYGKEDEFHRRLEYWRTLPEMGFTSTPEAPEPTRSDAHAWGGHPAWHSLASIAGVRPSAPAFRTVRIAPCPGSFKGFQCSVGSPHGAIEVDLRFDDGKPVGSIVLPDGVHGEFVWRGSSRPLEPGKNAIL